MKPAAQRITPFLWFDRQAEEAMQFYVSVFSGSPKKDGESRILSISRHTTLELDQAGRAAGLPDRALEDHMKGMEGKVLTGVFELAGQRFMALDGGTLFKFTEAISLYLECDNQQEVDYFWEKLSADHQAEQCGWLKDKFGVSWQVIPTALGELMGDRDTQKATRVMQAMLKMKKIDVEGLKRAYEGR